MKQKRFKRVVEKKHSWVEAIIYFLLGLLFFTQATMTFGLLSNMGYPSLLLGALSYSISGLGLGLIIISISCAIKTLTTRKVYYVEVKG